MARRKSGHFRCRCKRWSKSEENFREKALSIFIAPPSIDELERRLISRATDDLKPSKPELPKAKEEMSYAEEFDQIIINDDLETAQKEIERIVRNFIEEFKPTPNTITNGNKH